MISKYKEARMRKVALVVVAVVWGLVVSDAGQLLRPAWPIVLPGAPDGFPPGVMAEMWRTAVLSKRCEARGGTAAVQWRHYWQWEQHGQYLIFDTCVDNKGANDETDTGEPGDDRVADADRGRRANERSGIL